MDADVRRHHLPQQPPVPVWYCTPEAFPRLLRWSIASDRGTLSIGPGSVQFHGNRKRHDLREITGARLTGFYWPTVAMLALEVLLLLLISGLGFMAVLT